MKRPKKSGAMTRALLVEGDMIKVIVLVFTMIGVLLIALIGYAESAQQEAEGDAAGYKERLGLTEEEIEKLKALLKDLEERYDGVLKSNEYKDATIAEMGIKLDKLKRHDIDIVLLMDFSTSLEPAKPTVNATIKALAEIVPAVASEVRVAVIWYGTKQAGVGATKFVSLKSVSQDRGLSAKKITDSIRNYQLRSELISHPAGVSGALEAMQEYSEAGRRQLIVMVSDTTHAEAAKLKEGGHKELKDQTIRRIKAWRAGDPDNRTFLAYNPNRKHSGADRELKQIALAGGGDLATTASELLPALTAASLKKE